MGNNSQEMKNFILTINRAPRAKMANSQWLIAIRRRVTSRPDDQLFH